MNCTNCGAQNRDDAKFCAGCGSPLAAPEQPQAPYQAPAQPTYQPPVQPNYQQPAQPNYQQAPYQPQQPAYQQPAQNPYQQPYGYNPYQPQQPQAKKNVPWLWIGIIAGVAAIALILFLVLGGGGKGGSAEAVAENFMEAAAAGDTDALEDMLYGDMKDRASYYSAGDVDGIEIEKFKVLDTETHTDKDELEEFAYEYDIDATVEEVQELSAEITMSYMGQEVTNEMDFLLFKVDGEWYVAEAD